VEFQTIVYLVSWGIPFILGFGILLGLFYLKHLLPLQKSLIFFFLIAFIFDLLMRTWGSSNGNNLILIPLFGLFELIFFSILYAWLLLPKYALLIGVLSLLGVLFISFECSTLKPADILNFQSYSRAVESFLIIVFSILFYFHFFLKQNNEKQKYLTLNGVILSFFSINLILLLPINFLINHNSNLVFYLLSFNIFVTALFYCFLVLFLWKNGKIQKRLSFGS